jgi:methylmalonyl-CoA/ethylmalonyl-CoA epimerase
VRRRKGETAGRAISVILGIDHIGLATDDPGAVGVFMAALGMHKSDEGVADGYGVACEFWQHAAGTGQLAMEIVSPARPDSAIAGRLTRSGPGLYHVAFAVDDLEEECARLRKNGFTAVDAEPHQGARSGMRVMFMYLRGPASLLIELVHYEHA